VEMGYVFFCVEPAISTQTQNKRRKTMGMLDLEYRKSINADQEEQTEKKLAEQLAANGINCESYNGNIELKKINTLFAAGSVSIKVKDGAIKLEGKVMPSVAALICIALSIIFDCIGLCGECQIENVLGMALVISLGAAGTIGSIITFFVSKELMLQKFVVLINSIEK
jgi:hypothetical protein